MTDRFVFDPRPSIGKKAFAQAARLDSLNGAVVAIIDNGKTNATVLLERIVQELQRSWTIAGVVQVGPPSPGYGGQPEDAATAAQWATAAVAAVGDCGSCCGGTVRDALIFEELGIPAVAVVTSPFLPSSTAFAEMHGIHDYKIVSIDHPIATLDDSQISQRASAAAPQIAAALTRSVSA